jgi:hypothetical protein
MVTQETLDKWYKDLWNILVDINIAINNAERLTKELYKEEKSIKRHGFFQHHWYQLKFIIVIRLCKLFDNRPSQKRNFVKLCNRIVNEKFDTLIIERINENSKLDYRVFKNVEQFKNCAKRIIEEIQSKKETIDKIVSARDDVYAHHDPDSNAAFVRFEDLKDLNDLAIKYYNDLHGQLYNVGTDLRTTLAWDIDYVLKIMSGDLEEKLQKFKE